MKRALAWPPIVLCDAVLVLGLAVAACGGPSQSPGASSSTPPAGPTAPSIGAATTEPSVSIQTPSASIDQASPSVTPSPRATPSDASAKACTGSAKTRDFFSAIAEAVAWPVYCAILPAGWFVEAGQYRLANGGQMVISYRTNTGAHLELREGRWCTDSASACSPHDAVVGDASFGNLQGQLTRNAGNLVLYVDPGASASWTATATGLDEGTFRGILSNLGLVKA